MKTINTRGPYGPESPTWTSVSFLSKCSASLRENLSVNYKAGMHYCSDFNNSSSHFLNIKRAFGFHIIWSIIQDPIPSSMNMTVGCEKSILS